ncbi:MAG TPA: phosphatidylserine decarboxylase family protein [Candidatus Caccomonas pullistercoris]|nr:phosphatidylserine decarboxylase family protein [Candidatus Caccomonas pullistercoris]
MGRIKRLKQIRLHREGTPMLTWGALVVVVLNALAFWAAGLSFWSFLVLAVTLVAYGIAVNFFRCPIRLFGGEIENTVVAGADGKVVVVEEVEENEYFHDRRIMVSIFMSLTNVHANWFPVEGFVKLVEHQNGNFHKAWLPKASMENERTTVVIETPAGEEVLVRQIAGAVARRIVTYARPDEECYIDEHLGFIKFGSRVDVFLPLTAEVKVKLGQATTGNQTVIAKLHPSCPA